MRKQLLCKRTLVALCMLLCNTLVYSGSPLQTTAHISPKLVNMTANSTAKNTLISMKKRQCHQSNSSKITKKPNLFVMSLNVLAPCWASPDFYSPAIAPYLDTKARRQQIIHFLNSISDKADIIALQETTANEFNYYKEALESKFYSFQAYHDKDYWSDWISPDIPWEPNGVAIFVKKSTFSQVSFQDLALTNDGNHSAYFEGALCSTGEKIRAASIHLDTALDSNRYLELSTLMTLMPPASDVYDIIAGDFNYGTQSAPIQEVLMNNHFIDVLYFLNKEEWTHPFDNQGDINSGIIDHIISRNLTPIDGQVISSNLWELYPNDEDLRAIGNLKLTGSDHFPLYTILNMDNNQTQRKS